jgi:hypothetical protein
VIALLFLAACGPEVSYRDEIFPLLQEHCTRCHSGDDPDAGLDVYSTGLEGLIDAPAAQSDLPLVTAYDSLNSYLFHKINGTQSLAGGSGTQMPIGQAMTDAEIELIRQWIDDGASW